LQRLRRWSLKTIAAQLTITLTTIGFSVLGVLASGQILYTHLGLKTDRPLAVLVLASFAATIRFPEPTFRWHKQALPPPSDAIADLPLANVIAVLFLGLASPLFSHTFSMPSDTLSLLGLSRNLPLLLIVGLLGGMALDFVLRAHRQIRRGVGLAFGIVIILSGLSHTLSIPALTVGLIAGIWLVNSTVAKRDVLQFASRASGVIEPLFFLILGSLIGGYGGGVFFEAGLLVPLSLLLLLFRTIGRMIGLVISQHAWLLPKTWREVMDLSWRPMDILSAAIGVQGLFLLQLSHNTLIAAMILATLLTQGLIFPPRQQPKRTISSTPPTGT
jgi:hypothetical protein